VTKPENSKVSLLIRVYNSERYLVPCLESALNQTYSNMEVIAVNDGSTDGSAEILERYSDRIRIVNTAHRGRPAAFNTGISSMTGEWLTSLDSDDIIYPDAVERLVMAAERLNSSSVTRVIPFFDFQILGADGRSTGRTQSYRMDNSMGPIEQGVSMFYTFFGNSSVSILHRSILGEIGGRDETLEYYDDLELNLRLTLVYKYRFHHIPGIIAGVRTHDGQWRSIEGRYNMRKSMLRKTLAGMSEEDRHKYHKIKASKRTGIIGMCRSADRLMGGFAYSGHDSAAARFAADALAALLANPALGRLVDAITYRIRTVKISNSRASSPDHDCRALTSGAS